MGLSWSGTVALSLSLFFLSTSSRSFFRGDEVRSLRLYKFTPCTLRIQSHILFRLDKTPVQFDDAISPNLRERFRAPTCVVYDVS